VAVHRDQLHTFLEFGVTHHASDVHFRVGEPPLYRVHGVLTPLKAEPLTAAETEAICRLMLADFEQPRIERDAEIDTSYTIAELARFRVHMYRQRGTWGAVLRIIPIALPTIESLGLPAVVADIAQIERGLVLVAGTTGSGKSSTLAAILHQINQTRRAHILTLEDPIEFVHASQKASFSQREVGLDTTDFRVALRAALREDPDVILVGEMRDAVTIDIALRAAETGHVVFSTVHTTDAAKAIGRLVSVFRGDVQPHARLRLADNLRAIVSQRLLPRADGTGRVLAAEILINTATIADHIRDTNKTNRIRDIIELGRSQYGMQSFEQHLKDLHKAGLIDLDTALAASSNAADFQRSLHID
jgi:twitching motility protein PilT